ncbi:unnamed protein product [Prunus armeniaca]|uniref:Uncharacterized protein n=1 Tax=Prunus armeniaca TaxID=36596 RepID=A0A6J5WTE2_PRUAR|nr:unnamed protein product [Prunus armeniaca]
MVPLSTFGIAATTTAEAKAAAGTPSLSWRKSMRMRSSLRVRLEMSGPSFSNFPGAATAAKERG